MKLPDKIAGLRKSRGISQEELAERLGVSRQAVSRWETGSAKPDANNILQLSLLFHVTTDYLILGEEAFPSVSVAGLSQEQIHYVAELIGGLQTSNLVKELVQKETTAAQLYRRSEEIFGKTHPDAEETMKKLIDLSKRPK